MFTPPSRCIAGFLQEEKEKRKPKECETIAELSDSSFFKMVFTRFKKGLSALTTKLAVLC